MKCFGKLWSNSLRLGCCLAVKPLGSARCTTNLWTAQRMVHSPPRHGSNFNNGNEWPEWKDPDRDVKSATTVSDLIRICSNGEEFNAERTAQAFNRLKNLCRQGASGTNPDAVIDAFTLLSQHANDYIRWLRPRHIGIVLGAFASQSRVPMDEQLIRGITSQIIHQKKHLDAQGIANILWSFAKMGVHPGQEVISALSRKTVIIWREFKAQEVSNSLWALAALGGEPERKMISVLCTQAAVISKNFKAQEISNTVWALTRLGWDSRGDLIPLLCKEAVLKSNDFNSQEIANFLWAYATCNRTPGDEVVSLLCQRAVTIMGEFNARDVSNTCWSIAVFHNHRASPSNDIVPALFRQAVSISKQFNAQGVANMLWSLVTLDRNQEDILIDALCQQAVVVSKDFKAQEISNTIWALAKLRYDPGDELISMLCKQVMVVSKDFIAQEIAITFWSFSVLGIRPQKPIVEALCRQAVSVSSNFQALNVSNIMWAFAVLDVFPGSACIDALCQQAMKLPTSDFDADLLNQIHQALVHFCTLRDQELPLPPTSLLEFQARLKSECRESFDSITKQSKPSQLQRNVFSEITALGYVCDLEAVDPTTGISIDILVKIPWRDSKGIAVEVDGPNHFVKYQDKHRYDGRTLFKMRLLRKLQYDVVSIRYSEWGALSNPEKGKYLAGLLLGSSLL